MRYKYSEIDSSRILGAIRRRIEDVPEALSWHFSADAAENRKAIEKYKNIHRGERCFIIANGPSLNKIDVRKIKNDYAFSMNRAYMMYDSWGFVPRYFVCINDLVISQFHRDICNIKADKFVNYSQRRILGDGFNYLRLPPTIRDNFSLDMSAPITSGGTVTFAALQLAFYMGFSEVVIVGMDHRFSEKGTPNKTEIRQTEVDSSHVHPDYFPKGIKWQLPDLVRSEYAYALARNMFEKNGRRILDATVDGACAVFPKVDFKKIF